MQTHPMPADRVAALETIAKASPYWDSKDLARAATAARHDAREVGRLPGAAGHCCPPLSGQRSQPSGTVCARHFDLSQLRICGRRFAQIDALIQVAAQQSVFLRTQRPSAARGAAGPPRPSRPCDRLPQLSHENPLIEIMLAQALNATNNPKLAEEAVSLLRSAIAREPEAPEAYSQLAMAYGRKGDLANADLASAQAAFARGDLKTARQLATRAKTRLPVGSPAWVRADDIVNVKPNANARVQ